MNRYWILCLAVLTLFFFSACGGAEENTEAQPAESSQGEAAQKPEASEPDQAEEPAAQDAETAPSETPDEPPAAEAEPAEKESPPASATASRPAPPAKADKPKPAPPKPSGPHPGLLDPSLANETAPDLFQARLETTKGDVVVEVHREWAPRGADRFYNLVKIGYFQDIAYFRVVGGFMAQFGIHGDPNVSAKWRSAGFADDPVKHSNLRGTITFATSGPNSRTVQLFINYTDRNAGLDGQGFSPFGQVISGMEVVDSLYNGYGDGPPSGPGPDQGQIQKQGNAYLKANFPNLDYIKKATLVN